MLAPYSFFLHFGSDNEWRPPALPTGEHHIRLNVGDDGTIELRPSLQPDLAGLEPEEAENLKFIACRVRMVVALMPDNCSRTSIQR